MSEQFKSDLFAAQLNTKFVIRYAPDAAVEAELIEVAERTPTPRQTRFSVVFAGPRRPVLRDAIYQIEHPVLGTFPLFLSPFEADEEGVYYEAVFNFLQPYRRPR